MKMLMLVYSGSEPQRVEAVLDAHAGGGYSEFRDVRGAGATGRREGSRAWPGTSTMFVSVVPGDTVDALVARLREERDRLPAGERLHVTVLPAESFF